MKCTACKSGHLSPAYLDSLLPCHTCSHCGGSLLRMIDYFRWQEQGGLDEKEEVAVGEVQINVDAEETSKAILCPKTGGLMTKYRISKDTDHRLDFSAPLNAVWMDKGEWDLLKKSGLVNRLNNVFTNHWQQDIRAQESVEVMEELYRRRFGAHYEALKECRNLLDTMAKRSEAVAYLMADDPYDA